MSSSYPVLSATTPPARLSPFGLSIVGLILAYPDVAPRVLGKNLDISTVEAEIDALSKAETARLAAQQVESLAVKAAEDLAEEGRKWCGTLRENSRQLALHEDGAAVLQLVLVDPFPLPYEIRVADLPAVLDAMSRAAAPYAEALADAGYTPASLAYGADLGARLSAAQRAAGEASSLRSAATGTRDDAQMAVVKRMRKLCGKLKINLPKEGKARLKSLRATWLPRQSESKPEPAPASDGTSGTGGTSS